MPPSKIKIKNSDIAYAERILFGKIGDFKGERKEFIKNLDTIDLQAVPGSGKTTVLLAKLLIMEKHLPFKDGSGILVISHTNTAIDEIKDKISKYCPKLFAYPNFIGTIQRFVDTFLALPFMCSYFKARLPYIDSEVYQKNLWQSFQEIYWDEEAGCPGKWFWGRHFTKAKEQSTTDEEAREICKRAIEEEVKDLYLDFNDRKIKRSTSGKVVLATKGNPKYDSICEMIEEIVLQEGIISFMYAYHLAEVFLNKAPIVKTLLQKRFRYVFVDEMQDMDTHQYDLLEKLFYDNSMSSSKFQRIGDKNQAIFSGNIKFDQIWQDRSQVLNLIGSRRLSQTIAKVAEPFGMPRQPIKGENNTNSIGTENDISPHVIVFDDNSVLRVIEKFCELVKKYQKEGRIPTKLDYPIKVIAWRKGDDGKFGLKNYYPDFESEISRIRIDYSNLSDYLVFAKKQDSPSNALESVYKNIMNALLKLLRLEQVKNPNSKTGYFTINSLQRYLRENHIEFYEEFRLKLFHWCRDVYAEKINNVYIDLKDFLPRLLAIFGAKLEESFDFVNSKIKQDISNTPDTKPSVTKNNLYRCKKTGIEVQIGTVHSVKGETHTATLYLESYYQNDGTRKNPISYESQRLSEQFKGKDISDNSGIRKKQSARMVYVGFSRPTHFLCFACHKKRFDAKNFTNNQWQIEKIY